MERKRIWHTRIGLAHSMVDRALGSGWHLTLDDDDDGDDVILPSYPHRHTRTFVHVLTHVLCRVLHGSSSIRGGDGGGGGGR